MSRALPIIIMVFCSMSNSIASLLMKLGAEKFMIKINFNSLMKIFTNWKLLLGIFIYMSSATLTIFVLKYERLSLIYPISSLTYVFIAILSGWLLKEYINKYKIIGVSLIIFGVVLVSI
jgi:drug/metabolite transporter (DMT)-like permease